MVAMVTLGNCTSYSYGYTRWFPWLLAPIVTRRLSWLHRWLLQFHLVVAVVTHTLPGDHDPVVSTEVCGWAAEGEAMVVQEKAELGAEELVAGHAPRHHLHRAQHIVYNTFTCMHAHTRAITFIVHYLRYKKENQTEAAKK